MHDDLNNSIWVWGQECQSPNNYQNLMIHYFIYPFIQNWLKFIYSVENSVKITQKIKCVLR